MEIQGFVIVGPDGKLVTASTSNGDAVKVYLRRDEIEWMAKKLGGTIAPATVVVQR